MWASGYEVYNQISPAYQRFLESLSATYAQPVFHESAQNNGYQIYSGERGAPENIGAELVAVHPVVRTNPGKYFYEAIYSALSMTYGRKLPVGRASLLSDTTVSASIR